MNMEDLVKLMADQIKEQADVDPMGTIREHRDTILAIQQLNELHTIAVILNRIPYQE